MAKRKERAEAKGSLATDLAIAGAVVGSPFGPVGSVVGGVIGGTAGLIIADGELVLAIDMIAIPAFQAYMIQGTPASQVYIKAGETILPTGGNVQDVQEAMVQVEAPKKRRKANPWIKFSKNFQYRARRKNESAPAYLSARAKAASKAYKKLKMPVKKPTKKGGRKK